MRAGAGVWKGGCRWVAGSEALPGCPLSLVSLALKEPCAPMSFSSLLGAGATARVLTTLDRRAGAGPAKAEDQEARLRAELRWGGGRRDSFPPVHLSGG